VFDPEVPDADLLAEPRDAVQRRVPLRERDALLERQRGVVAPDAGALELVEGGVAVVAGLEEDRRTRYTYR